MTEAHESDRRGRVLLRLARAALEEAFGLESEPVEAEPWLQEPGATFVTLRLDGVLCGCIGTLNADRPLLEDLRYNARAAAFNDPRFPELRAEDLETLEIEVSLLSPVEPIECESEEDLLAQLRPHVDGLVIESGFHRGTFLPQVWRQLPEPRDFLRALKRKAGMDRDAWPPDVRVSRYKVTEWEEGLKV